MKKTLNSPYAQLTQNELNNLTIVLKETIALEFSNPISKVFTTADLWNIRSRAKTSMQRKFL